MQEAIAIHDFLIEKYGGSFGLRDKGLLESALSQPQASFFGELLHATLSEQAAAYLYHLCKNHPFIDGNKRTALGVMDAFLRVNNYGLTLSNDELYNLVLEVAESQIDKSQLAAIIKQSLIYSLPVTNED
ncbi:MAG: type II toxin-antitoxin system death-on-curing family toxin [Nostocaceae cyanobacterium]|nr:type II toxin-antitoxin system death-on-curing family toxin [Nostocaceae cyanobacterium]